MAASLFTPLTANRTLPLVRRIVADILAKGSELREAVLDPGAGRRERVAAPRDELRALVAELSQIGCSYKDWGFDIGLVDFPARFEGRPVLLCWRSDEETVAWYHEPDAGFAGRRRVPERWPAEAVAAGQVPEVPEEGSER